MKPSKNIIKQLSVLLWCAMFSAPLLGYASECTSDADCLEEEYCELLEVSLSPCFIDEDGNENCGNDTEENVEEMGFCEERAIECEANSDCPSHLTCVFQGSIREANDGGSSSAFGPDDTDEDRLSPEESTEEAPEPEQRPVEEDPVEEEPVDEGGMCLFIADSCEADNDCAMNFHCEVSRYSVGCAEPAFPDCAEDEDCQPEPVECEDEEISEGSCMPNEIECDNDAACPTDWRCREHIEVTCGTEDRAVSTSSSDSSEPRSEEDRDRQVPEENPCEEITRSLCMPIGLGGSSGYVALETATTNDTTPSTEEGNEDTVPNDSDGSTNADVEEGGCSASPSSPTPWALFGLFALLGLRRRLA